MRRSPRLTSVFDRVPATDDTKSGSDAVDAAQSFVSTSSSDIFDDSSILTAHSERMTGDSTECSLEEATAMHAEIFHNEVSTGSQSRSTDSFTPLVSDYDSTEYYFLPGTEKSTRYFIAIAASRAIGTPVV